MKTTWTKGDQIKAISITSIITWFIIIWKISDQPWYTPKLGLYLLPTIAIILYVLTEIDVEKLKERRTK